MSNNPLLWAGVPLVLVFSAMIWEESYSPSLLVEQIFIITGTLFLIGGGGRKVFFALLAGLILYHVWKFSGAGLLHLTTPRIHFILLSIATVLYFIGGVVFGARQRFLLALFSVVFAVAGTTPLMFRPTSALLERSDIEIGSNGIVTTNKPLYVLRDDRGESFMAIPGAAETPWSTRHGSLCALSELPCGLIVSGVIPEKSEFLPIRNTKERVAAWTYLGGAKSVISPLDPVRTSVLNHGYY